MTKVWPMPTLGCALLQSSEVVGGCLRPIVGIASNHLLVIDKEHLLGIWLDALGHVGIDEVLINVNLLPDVVRDHSSYYPRHPLNLWRWS